MSKKDDAKLTPEELDYKHLPEQTMYKVQIPGDNGGDSESVRQMPLIIRTNEFRLLYFELDPAGEIGWHTHVPGLDEVNLCLEGRVRYTLEREDGSHQTLELDPMEFVYIPGGARHKIETVGNQVHKSLSAAKFDTVARLEVLENNSESAETDTDELQWHDALFVDRKRDEVVAKDDTLVSS
ncbi:cupin domain-containing protein [Natronosalvus amylolyticus]|uniref:cupin domain-containing protein n=1 Tax=Natronosalvus amylolyticus TaxID=2961994 RepID=UPI0020C991D9|nr:cupin domain-containing protein [Natronosalvus amylolyticus]